jgi:hypothetical protein
MDKTDETGDYAVLDFGVFITGSTSHSGRKHRIRISYVPRVGPAIVEPPWSWETATLPTETLQSILFRLEAFVCDAAGDEYGVQQRIPW